MREAGTQGRELVEQVEVDGEAEAMAGVEEVMGGMVAVAVVGVASEVLEDMEEGQQGW